MIFTGFEIVTILFIHWVADFILQTHWQASNKSKNNIALLSHTGIYSISTFILLMLFTAYGDVTWITLQTWMLPAFLYGGISFVVHTITDYFTSRWTSKLYAKGDIHNFFVVIGFDQLLHFAQLFLTYHLIYH